MGAFLVYNRFGDSPKKLLSPMRITLQQSSEFMTKSGGEIAQGKAKDAGGLTPAKDDNAALRDCYSRTFAGNSDDCYRIKTAKFDLFRTCYPADNPAGRQTAREYRKLYGGFFCRFRSKYACILRCRGPPRKSESPSHLDFRRERNAKNSSV